MTKRQLEILQHTLGRNQYGQCPRFNFRNHFCAGPKDEPDCRELIALGYLKEHVRTEWLPYLNCSATDAGISAMMKESPGPPKLTRSQQRYRRYLDHDSGLTFREWLKDYGDESAWA